ncbi:MAG TPA: helix-turn-helix transcriptional regulator [Gaiellaceae bacterium]|jgi:DNA-binding NarL/FixJ family response regulator
MTNNERTKILATYQAHAARFESIGARYAKRWGHAPEPAVAAPAAESQLEPSSRETDVLSLVAAGLSNHEIGARLVISEETVKSHVRRLLGKLGARNRAHAVSIGYQRGLIVL